MKRTTVLISLFLLVKISFGQLLNGNMEIYNNQSYDTVPQSWSVSSPYATLPGRTSDAHSGNSAFVINTWYFYAQGFMVNGKLETYDHLSNWIKGGTPVSGKPVAVKGFYKYTEARTVDSALVQVILKKWNTLKNKPDTLCYGYVALPPVNTYMPFEVSIHDYSLGVQPDSIVIRFASHDSKNFGSPPKNYCRYLFIDDVSLAYNGPVTSIKKQSQQTSVSFYATQQELNVFNRDAKHFTVELWSLEGKLLLIKEITLPEDKIDILSFSKGVYLLKTRGDVFMEQKFFKE